MKGGQLLATKPFTVQFTGKARLEERERRRKRKRSTISLERNEKGAIVNQTNIVFKSNIGDTP